MKNKRKKKYVNRRFQVRTVLPVLLISIISFSIIITFIVFVTDATKSSDIIGATKDLEKAVKVEHDIIKSFNEYSRIVKNPIFSLATEKIAEDHQKSIDVISQNIHILKTYSERNLQFLALTVIVMVLNAVLIFIFISKAIHRASGPVHVMSQYLKDVVEGRKVEMRDIRKNDEFKELYEDFVKFLKKIEGDKKRSKTKSEKSKSEENRSNQDSEVHLKSIV